MVHCQKDVVLFSNFDDITLWQINRFIYYTPKFKLLLERKLSWMLIQSLQLCCSTELDLELQVFSYFESIFLSLTFVCLITKVFNYWQANLMYNKPHKTTNTNQRRIFLYCDFKSRSCLQNPKKNDWLYSRFVSSSLCQYLCVSIFVKFEYTFVFLSVWYNNKYSLLY